MAYWDQRGAGRSFDSEADLRLLTISRHIADLDAVVDHLREVFGQDRIVLIGHSWGSALGLLYAQHHPEKVSAFIGVNQLVSLLKAQEAQYDFVLREAEGQKDEVTIARLREIGPPPHESVEQQMDGGTCGPVWRGLSQETVQDMRGHPWHAHRSCDAMGIPVHPQGNSCPSTGAFMHHLQQ